MDRDKVFSSRAYPEIYGPKEIPEQIRLLQESWPELDGSLALDTYKQISLKSGGEALFAIVRWKALSDIYEKSLENELFGAIASKREFENSKQGVLDYDRLQLQTETEESLTRFSGEQKGDILIIPAQFGFSYAGHSPKYTRQELTEENNGEFGLDPFSVGCMLLTHPERLDSGTDLFVDCSGGKYDGSADDIFIETPCFEMSFDKLRFSTRFRSAGCGKYGSATGFEI